LTKPASLYDFLLPCTEAEPILRWQEENNYQCFCI